MTSHNNVCVGGYTTCYSPALHPGELHWSIVEIVDHQLWSVVNKKFSLLWQYLESKKKSPNFQTFKGSASVRWVLGLFTRTDLLARFVRQNISGSKSAMPMRTRLNSTSRPDTEKSVVAALIFTCRANWRITIISESLYTNKTETCAMHIPIRFRIYRPRHWIKPINQTNLHFLSLDWRKPSCSQSRSKCTPHRWSSLHWGQSSNNLYVSKQKPGGPMFRSASRANS